MKVHPKKQGEGLRHVLPSQNPKKSSFTKAETEIFLCPKLGGGGTNMDYMNSWNSLIKERLLLCNMAKNPSRLHKQVSKEAPVEFPPRT